MVRDTRTKECGKIIRPFDRDGEAWYEVRALSSDDLEQWPESVLREETLISF
jgi:hypothetical protein